MKKTAKSTTTKPKVVIWAIDPFEESTKPTASVIQNISQWVKNPELDIQPVYVVSPSGADLRRGLFTGVDDSQKALERYVAKFEIPNVLPGKVIVNESASRAGAVQELLEFAGEQGAAYIVLSSHGRSGFHRMILGSFAENVLSASSWPVFFLTHHVRHHFPKHKKQAVLFTTDFSENSHESFRQFIDQACQANVDVIIYHAISYPLPMAIEGAYINDSYFVDQERWANRAAAAWVEEAAAAGVNARPLIRVGGIGFITGDSILSTAKEMDVTAIVMTAVGDAMERVLLGSIAFDVFRANRFPVLMYGRGSLNRTPAAALG